ncbi:MAG: hypothetical protein A3F13_00805 [Gammaproteobacteria bacterium RIFCSPHIGHO2_12_FULL_40_19]|nr:MAG: hypothetical protein A3F13_00805 [Gammaproteobacteria bacterium RIFCSPHIGHO2_12_FULL_40_19]
MKTIKNLTVCVAVITTLGVSTAVLAGAFPPPPVDHSNVTINNNSPSTFHWQYSATYGACSASPSSANELSGQQGEQSNVTCSWTAQGEFDFTALSGQVIGSVNVGYGPCRLLSNNSPYQITVSGGVSACDITVSDLSKKQG